MVQKSADSVYKDSFMLGKSSCQFLFGKLEEPNGELSLNRIEMEFIGAHFTFCPWNYCGKLWNCSLNLVPFQF